MTLFFNFVFICGNIRSKFYIGFERINTHYTGNPEFMLSCNREGYLWGTSDIEFFVLRIPHCKVMWIFYKGKIHSDLYFWLIFFIPIVKFSYCYNNLHVKPDEILIPGWDVDVFNLHMIQTSFVLSEKGCFFYCIWYCFS